MQIFLWIGFLGVLILGSCRPAGDPEFVIRHYDLNVAAESLAYQQWLTANVPIYADTATRYQIDRSKFSWPLGKLLWEDEQFMVYGSDSGEFGGYAAFIEKKDTSFVYYLEANPQMVEKREDGYYVVSSIAHGHGVGQINRIKDPKTLVRVPVDSLHKNWQSGRFPAMDDFQQFLFLKDQGEVLIDTFSLMFHILFDRAGKNLMIYSDVNGTYVGTLPANREVKLLDTLLLVPTYGYSCDIREQTIIGRCFSLEWPPTDNDERRHLSGEIFVQADTIITALKTAPIE